MANAIPVSKQEPKQPEAKAPEKKPEPKGVPVGTHDAVRVDN
jgi:hypothetical protein